MRKSFYILLLLFSFQGFLAAQTSGIASYGKDFWFSFPGGYHDFADFWGGGYLVISSKKDATVNIQMPSVGIMTTVAISANSAFRFDVPTNVTSFGSLVVNNKSMHVFSDEDINIYSVSIGGADDDGSWMLPISCLDTFYVTSQAGNYYGNMSNIIAVCDSTVVRLTAKDSIQGLAAGEDSVFLLNQGDVLPLYTIPVMSWPVPVKDMSGLQVSANKKIAVISGSTSYYIPAEGYCCADMMFHQLLPSSLWGNEYFLTQHRFCTINYYEVSSASNGNTIYLDGVADTVLNAYEKYGFMLSGDHILTSDQGVQCIQYQVSESYDLIDHNGDPSTLVMMPGYVTQDTISFYVRMLAMGPFSTDSAFVNIISKTSDIAFVQLDSTYIALEFDPIPSRPDYSVAKIPLDTGNHLLLSPKGVMAYYIEMYSQGGHVYELGGYIKNVNLILGFEDKYDSSICEGDSLLLQLVNPNWEHVWEDGLAHSPRMVRDSGIYRLTVFNDCDTLFQTIHISYIPCDSIPIDTIPIDTTPIDTIPIDSIPIDTLDGEVVMPDAFSPNGDGVNDLIGPLLKDDAILEQFLVFNRWGQLVFNSELSGSFFWDGRFKGKEQEMNVYVYMVRYRIGTEEKLISGHIHLIR